MLHARVDETHREFCCGVKRPAAVQVVLDSSMARRRYMTMDGQGKLAFVGTSLMVSAPASGGRVDRVAA
jgi:hypothetical protein